MNLLEYYPTVNTKNGSSRSPILMGEWCLYVCMSVPIVTHERSMLQTKGRVILIALGLEVRSDLVPIYVRVQWDPDGGQKIDNIGTKTKNIFFRFSWFLGVFMV